MPKLIGGSGLTSQVGSTVTQTGDTVVTGAETVTGLETVGSLVVQTTAVVGAAGPNASAILELSSTTKGFLPPRMSTAQRDAILAPVNGLLIYNTSTGVLNYYLTGTGWKVVSTPAAPIEFNVEGPYTVGGATQTGVMTVRVPFACTVSSAVLMTKTAGTAGSLTIDVKYSTNQGGAWASIFQTLPTVAYTAGNYATNSGALTGGSATLAAGSLLRLDITAVQTAGEGFVVHLNLG